MGITGTRAGMNAVGAPQPADAVWAEEQAEASLRSSLTLDARQTGEETSAVERVWKSPVFACYD